MSAILNRLGAFAKRTARAVLVPVLAVLMAFMVGGIIIAASGSDPLSAYAALFRGSFGDARVFGRTLEKTTPLIFNGLAVAFAFRAGLFNIGAQGQLLFGAITAAVVGIYVQGLPPFLHAALALAAGGVAGGLWGAIPGALKTYSGAHEVITTIMLNYVAINMTDYLADGPLKDTTGTNIVARTAQVADSAKIGTFGEYIPIGALLAVVVAVATWWLLWRTPLGFEIRTVGLNPHAARYAGIRVARIVILTMVLSGIMAGLGGGVETLGVVGRFQPGFNAGLGFDGITVALLGKTHPLGAIPAALIIGAMKAGQNVMQFDAKIASEIIDVVQALVLFFVAADIIIRRLIRLRAAPEEKITLTTGWGR